MGLVGPVAGDALDQLVIGNGIAIAEHHGRHLGVEDRVRDGARLVPDDFDILTGGVEHLQHRLIGHQLEEWLEIDALGQRVDHDRFVRACHLNDAEQGIIGRLAQELGIDGNNPVLGEAVADGCEFRSCGNQIHERSITLPRRRSAESADMSRVLRRIRALKLRSTVDSVACASQCRRKREIWTFRSRYSAGVRAGPTALPVR